MEEWHRLAFTHARVAQFSEALQRIHDAQRHADWPPELGVFVTDDWVHLADEPSLVIYFAPAAAEMFASLISERGGESCLKPLPFGLEVHGNSAAWSLLAEIN